MCAYVKEQDDKKNQAIESWIEWIQRTMLIETITVAQFLNRNRQTFNSTL